MNTLDDKVIVDRDVYKVLLCMAKRASESPHVHGKIEESWLRAAQMWGDRSLAGWAAVPVAPDYALIQLGNIAYKQQESSFNGIEAAYTEMLTYSPPLPGGVT